MKVNMPQYLRNQQGAALMTVLILLLVVTLLGLVTLRGAIMEERMSANLFDRSLAFQSAEIALREAEAAILAAGSGGPAGAIDCKVGSAASTTAACSPTLSNAFSGSGAPAWTNTVGEQSSASAGKPQYVIQFMGRRDTNQEFGTLDDPNYGASAGTATAEFFRVTARSNDPSGVLGQTRAVTVLQSTIVRQ